MQAAADARPSVPVLSESSRRRTTAYDGGVAGVLSRRLTAPVGWRQVLGSLPAHRVQRVVGVGAGGCLPAS